MKEVVSLVSAFLILTALFLLFILMIQFIQKHKAQFVEVFSIILVNVIWIGACLLIVFFLGKIGLHLSPTPTYDRTGEIADDNGPRYEEMEREITGEYLQNRQEVYCESCYQDFYCKNMGSCDRAVFCMKTCGMSRLDADNNGVPCEWEYCGTP